MRYSESQTMKYSGKWYLLSFVIFIAISGLSILLLINIKEIDIVGLIILSLMPILLIGVFIYLSLLELNIIIDDHGISYKMNPLFDHWKHISKRDVLSYRLISANFSEARNNSKNKTMWIGKNKRFMVLGTHLLELSLSNNRKVGLSTCCPNKIEKGIQQLLNKK